jgi:zinc protease
MKRAYKDEFCTQMHGNSNAEPNSKVAASSIWPLKINYPQMKKITLSILAIALTTGLWAQGVDRSIKPKPGPAPEIKLGKSESFTLPNGMQVFVVENHKLPTIAVNIELDIKPELEGDMSGYRDMMSELLLSGTKTRAKDKLNKEIDQMGVNINISSDAMSGTGLKKYAEKIFDLMADIAMNTKITAEELEKAKKKTISGLETQKNEPDAMVRNVSSALNFGKNHPYGEINTEETVKKITLARCENYYKTYFRPNVAYMAIVGDITLAEIKPLIEKYFGKWEKANVPVTNYSVPGLSITGGAAKITKVAFAPRTAAVQSVISVTYPVNLKPGTPDVIKAKVANAILGGGSQGRLFLHIREAHGWGYGSYSSLREDELGGTFSATLKIQNKVSDSALGILLDEMRIMGTEKVSEASLQSTINYLSGNFAISLEDPKRVAQFAINIQRYHMPADYYQNYLKNLSAVTADDVMEMSKKYILANKANIVVAGSKDDVAGKLARFSADGKVDYYDYAGRPLVASETSAAPAGVTADIVYNNYIKAMGGEAAYNSIKDIKITGSSVMQGTPLVITEIKKAPNMWKQSIEVSMGGKSMVVQKQVFNGTKGYQEVQGKKSDITGDDLDEIIQGADIAVDLHSDKYGIKRSLKGMEEVNGSKAYVLNIVNGKGKRSTEYYDATSGLLVKKVQGEGEKLQSSEYNDYKEVPGTGGYKVPYKVTETQGGQSFAETVTGVEVNKGVADTEFN